MTGPMLTGLVPNLTDRDAYLCSPAGLSNAVPGALREAGVRPDQVHEERFTF